MKVLCPNCEAEMCLENTITAICPATNAVIFRCPQCGKRSLRTFHAAGGGTSYSKQPDTPNDQLHAPTKLIHCKDCAHLCHEDIGIYYCGNLGICGLLNPDDYCSRGERKEKKHENR